MMQKNMLLIYFLFTFTLPFFSAFLEDTRRKRLSDHGLPPWRLLLNYPNFDCVYLFAFSLDLCLLFIYLHSSFWWILSVIKKHFFYLFFFYRIDSFFLLTTRQWWNVVSRHFAFFQLYVQPVTSLNCHVQFSAKLSGM